MLPRISKKKDNMDWISLKKKKNYVELNRMKKI